MQKNFDKKEKERLEKRKEIEKQDKIDSLNLDKFLKNAIKIAEQNINLDKFKKEYVETMSDSLYQVEISIISDFYFSKENPHLIIRRNTPGSIYIDIFSKKGSRINKVISHEQWNMTYVNDTIRDINGDGLKDFVVNWYGSSGCCLKAFSNIYLLRPDKKTFSKNIEFINPTFSPKEKIIRGVCYGHPGETEMYKYKWIAEKVDTLEYISYQKSDKGVKTGKVIISTDQPYGDKNKILKIVNSVPTEYRKIEGYDWFTGHGYE
ncbi:XAC2610-related protein [Flavobacterium sp. SM2513]|uniref:XAC2610-related protein n=1 Tax=Flavobacterium sp. SM2513 TaxID=3424766 RepID=UPI003D7F7BD2